MSSPPGLLLLPASHTRVFTPCKQLTEDHDSHLNMLCYYLQLHGSIAGYGYITRRADSEGVALGALSVPWACTGLILMGWRYAVETGQLPQTLIGDNTTDFTGGAVDNYLQNYCATEDYAKRA